MKGSGGWKGANLVFVVSQPRSGSTLLQRMLGAHPDVATVGEPWIMLNPLYALRREGWQAEYNARLAHDAMSAFVEELPNGREDYYEALRRMCGHLYGRILEEKKCRLFVDKTPRYYEILEELPRVFPDARFIVLFRNPASVLLSIRRLWVGKNLFAISSRWRDLFVAPELLVTAVHSLQGKCLVVRFEELVSKSDETLDRVCSFLDLGKVDSMLAAGARMATRSWQFGDHSYKKMDGVQANRSEAWRDDMKDPISRAWAAEYLSTLGPELLAEMGYVYEDLVKGVLSSRRGRLVCWLVPRLRWFRPSVLKDGRGVPGGLVGMVQGLARQTLVLLRHLRLVK